MLRKGLNVGLAAGTILLWVVTMLPAPLPAQQAQAVSRTFAASFDRVWVVTESVLKSLGWEIDEEDRDVGWIVTDSRGVQFKDFAVYGEGTRHKLRVTLKSRGAGETSVAVQRELWKEERILWMKDRELLQATDTHVETAVLDAVAEAL